MTEQKITLELTIEELKMLDKYVEYCEETKEFFEKLKNAYPQPKMEYQESGTVDKVEYNGHTYLRIVYNDPKSFGGVWWKQIERHKSPMNIVTDDETRNILEGLWYNQVKKDESTKPMDEVVERLVKKYQTQKLRNILKDYGFADYTAENICQIVEDWLPSVERGTTEEEKLYYSRVEELYKEWWGQYPELETDSKYDDIRWQGFQAGYELAQLKDSCPEPPDEPEHYDEIEHDMSENVENKTIRQVIDRWWTDTFTSKNMGSVNECIDDLADQVQFWILRNKKMTNRIEELKEGTSPPEPTSNEFRQKLFDGIKSVFYDPKYERTHWKMKVNMAVDEVLTHFYDIIPDREYPSNYTYDTGWNDCIDAIMGEMELEE